MKAGSGPTFVNGKLLAGGASSPLVSGDRIIMVGRCGSTPSNPR